MQPATRQKPAIVVTAADLADEALALLDDFEIVFAGKQPDEQTLIALCASHQPVAIIVRYGRITAQIIAASSRLHVISKHGSGIDTIDIEAARSRNVAVKAATAVNAAAVAEHTWALILACTKSVTQLNARMHGGHWDKASHKSIELKGRTLGLIGLGAIGQRVATVGAAMGMRILGHDPYIKEAPPDIAMTTLPELLQTADIVSLHCPLTADNRRMINRETLSRMRHGAILVNTARGGLVDEAAVRDALESGCLRAAALDSFETEPPPPEHLLRNVTNLIMTPHVGGVTRDAYINMGVAAARNILAELQTADSTRT
ncbi:MAG: hydroxyacid dehydrogenase [Betaproteobacteria bacterium]